MNLLLRLTRDPARQRPAPHSGAHPAARPQPPQAPGAPAAEPAPVCACGWFDSSHDLQAGLHVTEHREIEAVVNQIPLSWWLGWELDAARSAVR
jgi:hypothetical protein